MRISSIGKFVLQLPQSNNGRLLLVWVVPAHRRCFLDDEIRFREPVHPHLPAPEQTAPSIPDRRVEFFAVFLSTGLP